MNQNLVVNYDTAAPRRPTTGRQARGIIAHIVPNDS